MIYKREITDPVMIQYIILYTMAEAKKIISHDDLTSIVLDNCNIKFTEFRIAVDNLEKIGHIRTFYAGYKKMYCELLKEGKQANSFFYKKIPSYIREPIKEYIKPFFKEEENKKSVSGALLPINENEYMADLGIYDGDVPIIEIKLYAGTRKFANSIIREFKRQPQRVYETIIEMLGNEKE